jgi:hypothetical protein
MTRTELIEALDRLPIFSKDYEVKFKFRLENKALAESFLGTTTHLEIGTIEASKEWKWITIDLS